MTSCPRQIGALPNWHRLSCHCQACHKAKTWSLMPCVSSLLRLLGTYLPTRAGSHGLRPISTCALSIKANPNLSRFCPARALPSICSGPFQRCFRKSKDYPVLGASETYAQTVGIVPLLHWGSIYLYSPSLCDCSQSPVQTNTPRVRSQIRTAAEHYGPFAWLGRIPPLKVIIIIIIMQMLRILIYTQ